jgi:hypothetical protein
VRLGYADPPYPGCSAKHYRKHKDFAGEVDSVSLMLRLEEEVDGWVLHSHVPALRELAGAMPKRARILSWCKTFGPLGFVKPPYLWEPVILRPARKPTYAKIGRRHRDWLVCDTPQNRGLRGTKPEGVIHWVLDCLGAKSEDEFVDLFPGTGAVLRGWESWRLRDVLFEVPLMQTEIANTHERLA